jgi:hypothetical protein
MLTAAQFEAIAFLMGAREPVKSAARAVLVDGKPAVEASRSYGVSPQSICNSVRRYYKAQAVIEAAFCAASGKPQESNN